MIKIKNWHRRGWKYGKFNLKTKELKVSKNSKRWYSGAEILVGAEQ